MQIAKKTGLWLGFLVAVLAVGGIVSADARAEMRAPRTALDLKVKYDQVRLFRLEAPASEVIVGNPSIADVTLLSSKRLAIAGRTYGTTNLIVLDAEGRVITERRLVVEGENAHIVNLARGTDRQSYNCTPRCRSILVIGNEKDYFNRVASQSKTKMQISESVAAGNTTSE